MELSLYEAVAQKLKIIREYSNLTVSQIAKIAEIEKEEYQEAETDARKLSIVALTLLCRFYSIPTAYFVDDLSVKDFIEYLRGKENEEFSGKCVFCQEQEKYMIALEGKRICHACLLEINRVYK